MRYWLISILTTLASLVGAEESPERWDGWDELPEDVLDLGGATSAELLSQRLDRLIQQNPDSAEIDRLLELWLEQASAAGRAMAGQAISLQSLVGLVGSGGAGGSSQAALQQREKLQQLLQGLPANPGAATGDISPVDLPSNQTSDPNLEHLAP